MDGDGDHSRRRDDDEMKHGRKITIGRNILLLLENNYYHNGKHI